jgi:hypothetical protein
MNTFIERNEKLLKRAEKANDKKNIIKHKEILLALDNITKKK